MKTLLAILSLIERRLSIKSHLKFRQAIYRTQNISDHLHEQSDENYLLLEVMHTVESRDTANNSHQNESSSLKKH